MNIIRCHHVSTVVPLISAFHLDGMRVYYHTGHYKTLMPAASMRIKLPYSYFCRYDKCQIPLLSYLPADMRGTTVEGRINQIKQKITGDRIRMKY